MVNWGQPGLHSKTQKVIKHQWKPLMAHLISDPTEYSPLRKYAMLTHAFLPPQGQPDTMLYH